MPSIKDRLRKFASSGQKEAADALSRIIELEAALEESHALNVNWVAVAEPEMLHHLSEYKRVIELGEKALKSSQ